MTTDITKDPTSGLEKKDFLPSSEDPAFGVFPTSAKRQDTQTTNIPFGGSQSTSAKRQDTQTTSDIMGTIIGGLLLIAFFVALITPLFVTFRQIKKEWASRRIRQGVFVAIVWVVSSSFDLFLSYLESGFDFAAALVFVPPLLAGLLFCLYRKIVG